ncbi:MAG: DUF1015 domain-containing protein [Dehalococcoidales bacterium]
MADIRPFHGIHYNPSQVKDLAKVICPPYDIIPPQLQQTLYERSENNFIRIEYGKELPQDKDNSNKYTRAAATLNLWLEQRVLIEDEKPALYLDEHQFSHQGKTLRRRAVNCIVRLEDWSKGIIRPHEGTLTKAKSDRLSMLWTLQANTSPIMALYEDKDGVIASFLNKEMKQKPAYSAANVDGESHRVWAVSGERVIGQVQDSLMNQPLYIADGHHRYESALAYQRERRGGPVPPGAKEEPYDFVMMTLLDMMEPGLVILPAHRLVRGLESSILEELPTRLNTFFDSKEYVLNKKDIGEQVHRLMAVNDGKVRLILCGLNQGRFLTLTLRDPDMVRPMFPAFHSELYQTLDVSIVDHVILEELLGISHEKVGSFLDYVNDAPEAIKKVQDGEYQLGIIVNPVKPEVIKAIADSGDRMPRKSTYFYPKVPAGLVTYRFA